MMAITKRLPDRINGGDVLLIKVSPGKDKKQMEELLTLYKQNIKHLSFWHHGWKELMFKNVSDIINYFRIINAHCYLLYLSEKLVGYIELTRLKTDRRGLKYRLLSFWIDKKHSRKGLMTRALAALEKELKKQKLDYLSANVDMRNKSSIQFLNKLEYKNICATFLVGEKESILEYYEFERKLRGIKCK